MSETKETTTTTTPVEETTTATTTEKKEETTTTEKKEEPTTKFDTSATTSSGFGKKEDDGEKAPDHEPNVEFTPKLNLQKQETKNAEEDEDILFEIRAKLFRYVTDPQPQWNERGTGQVKFLKHKETNKIRISMRRDKVLKVCLNHYISPLFKLEPGQGSDKSWVWKCTKDYADDEHPEGIPETFAIRFATPENANAFKDAFENAQKEMKILLNI